HEFAKNFMVSISYVGSHATNLQYVTNLNQITNPALLNSLDVSACNGATPASIAASPSTCERPYPAFGGLGGSNFNAISNYNSLQLVVQKRFSNGLSFNANYAWTHMLDEQDSAGWGSTAGAQVWQFGDNPASNYGNANFDVPQAFKATAYYELPFGIGRTFMNKNAPADAVLGGWRVSGTFILQSGTPFTVLDNGVNDYSQAGNVFANPVSSVSALSGSCPGGTAVGTLSCWFNPSAFETPAQQGNGAFGFGGRNTLFGPHLFNVDLSLAKTWKFKERFGFTLRSDFINALNHPSFTLPNNNVASSGVATIKGVSNAARTIQLGARFSF
ncbi:MAG: carboxypeptidase regulatory-like domain-containing protein, partial [Terriglobia bacterium]